MHPSAGEMNYAIVVTVAVWLFAICFWYFPKTGGKTYFTGPRTEDLTEDILTSDYAETHDYNGHSVDAKKVDGASITTSPVGHHS